MSAAANSKLRSFFLRDRVIRCQPILSMKAFSFLVALTTLSLTTFSQLPFVIVYTLH